MKCFMCGEEMTCANGTYRYNECGLDNVVLENVEICRCKSCNEEIVCIPDIQRLHTGIGKGIVQKKAGLNGAEIRFLRKNMGLKAQELKKYLGVQNATISRWEAGKQKISAQLDKLLRMVYLEVKGLAPEREIWRSVVMDDLDSRPTNQSTPPAYQIDLGNKSDACQMPAH